MTFAPDNQLLGLLNEDIRAGLVPIATVELRSREVLSEPGMPALYGYFPLTAVISLVSIMTSGASTEVALIGREGMVGLAGVLGTVESPTTAVVQIAGTALRLPIVTLRTARLRHAAVRRVLDLYTEARLIQVAQMAACSRLHSVEARLARWLLAIHDRIDGDEFTLPQELIGQMLGVRRPTVSSTLHRFRDSGTLVQRGRTVIIADRMGLERVACECHFVLHREFQRLLRQGRADTEALVLRSAAVVSSAAPQRGEAALETMREIAGRLLLANIREQEAREEAEAANRAKEHFLAMVSHELRTPLNAILGWCVLLARRPEEPPGRGLAVIRRNAEAQLKLVEDLLDVAQLTSGRLHLQLAFVSLSEIVKSAVDTVMPTAADKQVALHLMVVDRMPPMSVDPHRIRQAVLNVLTNALKFTDSGGAVHVQVGASNGSAHVTIQDTGCGIDSTVLPHVFEEFKQGPAPNTGRQGLGLGLTIAQRLVQLHGGTIDIVSAGERRGSTCTIDLPVRTDQEGGPSQAETAAP